MTRRYSKSDLALLRQDLGAELPPPVVRKSRRAEESAIQRQLVRWWDLNSWTRYSLSPLVLFSIPNGSNGDAKRGSILKAEGLRRGAPDLFLSIPREWRPSKTECTAARDEHGCYLELKTPTGRIAPEQESFHQILRRSGYRVVIVRSFDEGVAAINNYLT